MPKEKITLNKRKISLIKEIRGRGLMIGFVIDHEKFNLGENAPGKAF